MHFFVWLPYEITFLGHVYSKNDGVVDVYDF